MKTPPAQLRLRYVFGLFLCALLGSSLVCGQVAPAPASARPELKTPSNAEVSAGRTGLASAAADEPVELSPFVIMAEEDKGYQATSSLSGTRLRTDLRDIAASVSVITKELMEDLAADDLSILAAYTVGTEVGGLNGNFSDTDVFNETGGYVNDEPTRRNNSTPVIRVRGLGGGNAGGANRTRDYFLTNIPGDGYNVERIDFQRGPNGMLYGLGSPSGVVNESVIRARLQKNRTKVSTRFDNYGSYRGSIDHNQVLKKDKVAFRFAALYNREEYQIEEAFNLSRRIYGTVTYKPFSGTTLRVSGEGADIEGNPPRTMSPYDAYSFWWGVGRPVYNANTGTASYLGTEPTNPNLAGATRFLASGMHRANLPSLIVQNAATGAYGLGIPGNPQAAELVGTRVRRNATNTAWVNDGVYGLSSGRTYVQQINAPLTSDPTRPFWRNLQITDPAIFDFYHHQLDGDARSRNARWNTFNLALEQRLGPNAGLEVAYDRQHHDTSFSDWAQFGNYTLKLDVTTTLIDGTPNPNFGRPFLSDSMPRAARNNSLEAFRATAFYDFDFKRVLRPEGLLAKILGRHTLTANFTRQTNEVVYFYGTPMLDLDYWAVKQAANAGTATVASKLSTGPRQLNLIAYVGPSVIGQAGPQNSGLQPVIGSVIDSIPNRLSLYHYPTPPANTTVPATWTARSFGVVNPSDEYYQASIGSQATHTREVFKGVAAVIQSRWLADTLVSTVGLRRDWVRTFDAGGPIFDAATGVPVIDRAVYYPQPRINESHDAFNYGLVLHTPDFVQRRLPKGVDASLTYGRSDNFSPQAERFNVYGKSIDPTSGGTKEFGAIVNLFNRKLQLRLAHYETASENATAASFTNNPILTMDRVMYTLLTQIEQGRIEYLTDRVTPSTAAKAALLDFLRKPEAASFYSTDVAGYFIDPSGHLQGSGDRTINRVFATTDIVAKGWELDVTANPTRNWRVSFNVANQDTIRTNSGTDLAAMLESWRPFLVEGAAGDIPITDGSTTSLRTQYQATWMATLNRVRALDGSRSPELREWRFNFINSYSFSEGRLKGWSIGGALRWQDKSAIGYPIILIAGSGQYDVKHPYWGPTTTNVDGWIGYGRRIWKDRIGWKAQLNVRNIGVRDRLIPMTAAPDGSIDTYRISAGMTFALTNSFEF